MEKNYPVKGINYGFNCFFWFLAAFSLLTAESWGFRTQARTLARAVRNLLGICENIAEIREPTRSLKPLP